jgi:hypothetical protein
MLKSLNLSFWDPMIWNCLMFEFFRIAWSNDVYFDVLRLRI